MKNLKIKLLAIILCIGILSLGLVSTANSALITNINNLDIDGTSYNVTFHRDITFRDLFDIDDDLIYGEGDGSVINHAPLS